MNARPVFGVEIDICPVCQGVFLDPGEAEASGVETAALFGGGKGAAVPLGETVRRCARHARAMSRFSIRGADGRPVEIERAPCCGGIFLDGGEQGSFAMAAARAASLREEPAAAPPGAPVPTTATTETVTTASGAVFAMPTEATPTDAFAAVCRGVVAQGRVPAPEEVSASLPAPLAPTDTSGRTCPRCGHAYRADRSGGTEIDVCDGCGSMFFDPGETAARGIDTAALFGAGPEAARDGGPSPLACPACREPMRLVRITTLAGLLEVDRAPCCGGLFLDGGEHDPFARAARVAEWADADARYQRDGEVVGEAAMIRAMADGDNLDRAASAFVRSRVDSMLNRMVHARRHRIRRGRGPFDP